MITTLDWIIVVLAIAALGASALMLRQATRHWRDTDELVCSFSAHSALDYAEEIEVLDHFIWIVEDLIRVDPAREESLQVARLRLQARRKFIAGREPLLRALGDRSMTWRQMRQKLGERNNVPD